MRVLVICDNDAIKGKFKELVRRKNLCVAFTNSDWIKKPSDFPKDFDLLISLHCKLIFPIEVVKAIRCVNIHPGYNPFTRGWYSQVFGIIDNLPVGSTIHEMNERIDDGNIIARKEVIKYDTDTSETLYNRILEAEFELIEANIEAVIKGDYFATPHEQKGRLHTKADFEALKEIDMKRTGTFKEFYNYLRAMTHGDHKNCYFVNEKGIKTYLSLNITEDDGTK